MREGPVSGRHCKIKAKEATIKVEVPKMACTVATPPTEKAGVVKETIVCDIWLLIMMLLSASLGSRRMLTPSRVTSTLKRETSGTVLKLLMKTLTLTPPKLELCDGTT